MSLQSRGKEHMLNVYSITCSIKFPETHSLVKKLVEIA